MPELSPDNKNDLTFRRYLTLKLTIGLFNAPSQLVTHRRLTKTRRHAYPQFPWPLTWEVIQHQKPIGRRAALTVYFTIFWRRYPSRQRRPAPFLSKLLHRKDFPAPCPAPGQDLLACRSPHPCSESVCPFTLTPLWLICPFHRMLSSQTEKPSLELNPKSPTNYILVPIRLSMNPSHSGVFPQVCRYFVQPFRCHLPGALI